MVEVQNKQKEHRAIAYALQTPYSINVLCGKTLPHN